ncbi:MAG TPA: histidine kinase [Chitinophagaceae bacterium]|nr:histidine kinase [Chitinophagaceae bacterium]
MLHRQAIQRTLWFHFLFWIGVALLWFYLRYQDYSTLQQAALVTGVKVADLALAIYVANLLLVPLFLYQKKYGAFTVLFIVLIAATSFSKMLLLANLLPETHPLQFDNIKEKVYNNFVTQFFLVLASIGMRSVVDYLQLQTKMVQVAKERAEAELNFLKSQINPHFLFNSLNAVYFLIDKKNTTARSALHRFSEMLRYQLYECNGDRIPIEKEILYLKDYVGLQQLRLENTTVHFDCAPEVQQFSIEPLLLIPFVENSFKHLSHYNKEKENEIKITIKKEQNLMHFAVQNTTEEPEKRASENGIGLTNVKRRLALLYPAKHTLQVHRTGNRFFIHLQISLAT